MKSTAENKPTHVIKGNIFDALGFSASEATALKIKAEILSAILDHIGSAAYTQAQLVTLLDEHQPSVSNLLKGRIASVSIEKLLRYADRLDLETTLTIGPAQSKPRRRVTSNPSATKPRRREQTALSA
jgi:predicted XRE-type DNA-binding protein